MGIIRGAFDRINRTSAVSAWVTLHKLARRSPAAAVALEAAHLGADLLGTAMTSRRGERLARSLSGEAYQVGAIRELAMAQLAAEASPLHYQTKGE